MGQRFNELKRRNVFCVAVACVVADWLVLAQVPDLKVAGAGTLQNSGLNQFDGSRP